HRDPRRVGTQLPGDRTEQLAGGHVRVAVEVRGGIDDGGEHRRGRRKRQLVRGELERGPTGGRALAGNVGGQGVDVRADTERRGHGAMIAPPTRGVACDDGAMRFLVRLVVSSVAIWLTSLLLSGISLTEREGWEQVAVVAVVGLVFTLVNMIVKPVAPLFALPLTILTLGLFPLVINALMLLLTSWLTSFTDWGLFVDGFWWALLAALIISIISGVL